MNPSQLKQILMLRRSRADEADPTVSEAVEQARQSPELREWMSRHEAFQSRVRDSFRQLPVPADLPRRLLAARDRTRRFSWRAPSWAAAAAALVLLYFAIQALLQPSLSEDSFATFRSRMVSSVLRQYQMDIHTKDMAVIRRFLSTNQAPADYVLKGQLAGLPALGAGLQSWQAKRVSMVCLDSGGLGTAILFVVDAASVRKPPPSAPEFQQVRRLMTVSWTENGRAYLLFLDNAKAGREALQRLL